MGGKWPQDSVSSRIANASFCFSKMILDGFASIDRPKGTPVVHVYTCANESDMAINEKTVGTHAMKTASRIGPIKNRATRVTTNEPHRKIVIVKCLSIRSRKFTRIP